MTGTVAINPQTVIIEPRRGLQLRLREVWEDRDLLYFLTWRDIKVRYKQTALGALWAILQPLLTMLIFSLGFGRLAKVPSDGILLWPDAILAEPRDELQHGQEDLLPTPGNPDFHRPVGPG